MTCMWSAVDASALVCRACWTATFTCLNGGDELALIDPGFGAPGDFDTILDNIRQDGFDPTHIRKIILSHYHADHIGAAQEAEARLGAEVIASDRRRARDPCRG